MGFRRLNGRRNAESRLRTEVRTPGVRKHEAVLAPPNFRGGVNNSGAGRSSGFRIVRSVAPSPREIALWQKSREWHHMRPTVPDYSGGTAMDLHHLPFESPQHRETRTENDSLVNFAAERLNARPRGRSLVESRRQMQFCRCGIEGKKRAGRIVSPRCAPPKPFGVNPPGGADQGH